MTTSLADQTWAWLQPSLARLIESYTTDPDLPWDDRFRGFLDELALSEATDHPVTAALMEHLERLDDAERQAFLTAEAESFAYQLSSTPLRREASPTSPCGTRTRSRSSRPRPRPSRRSWADFW